MRGENSIRWFVKFLLHFFVFWQYRGVRKLRNVFSTQSKRFENIPPNPSSIGFGPKIRHTTVGARVRSDAFSPIAFKSPPRVVLRKRKWEMGDAETHSTKGATHRRGTDGLGMIGYGGLCFCLRVFFVVVVVVVVVRWPI